MLLRFTVGNYLSIDKPVTISLEAKSIKDRVETNVFEDLNHNISILKGLSFYGLNSGGKSNILKAIGFVKDFVLNSFNELKANDKIRVDRFKLSSDGQNRPSFFELEFIVFNQWYRYGFEVDDQKVHREWLYLKLKTTEKLYFLREDDVLQPSNNFREGWQKDKLTRPNALFLTTVAQLNGTISKDIFHWFQDLTLLSDSNYLSYINVTSDLYENPDLKKYIVKLFQTAQLGFEDIEIERIENDESNYNYFPEEIRRIIVTKIPYQLQIQTIHKKYDSNGKLIGIEKLDLKREESQGTQKFFAFIGPILDCLIHGKPIIIDELDAKLHPKLSGLIVKFFNSDIDNKLGAQLIFATHNPTILKDKTLRRDQIMVIYKNSRHATEAKTFHELGVRPDVSLEHEFLLNKFRDLPQIKEQQLSIFGNTLTTN